jgi:hypothetical protein
MWAVRFHYEQSSIVYCDAVQHAYIAFM